MLLPRSSKKKGVCIAAQLRELQPHTEIALLKECRGRNSREL